MDCYDFDDLLGWIFKILWMYQYSSFLFTYCRGLQIRCRVAKDGITDSGRQLQIYGFRARDRITYSLSRCKGWSDTHFGVALINDHADVLDAVAFNGYQFAQASGVRVVVMDLGK